jgi:hypothetical protein
MAQRTAFSLLMAGVLVCGDLAAAQPAPQPTTPSAAIAESQSAAHVTLGQAAVPLYGPWKFQIGDSPIDPKTGQPLWAEPAPRLPHLLPPRLCSLASMFPLGFNWEPESNPSLSALAWKTQCRCFRLSQL